MLILCYCCAAEKDDLNKQSAVTNTIMLDRLTTHLQLDASTIVETDKYIISVLKGAYNVFHVQTYSNVSMGDVTTISNALIEFVAHTSTKRPAYVCMDLRSVDFMTVEQIRCGITVLKTHQHLIQTRVVGSVVAIDESTTNRFIPLVKKLYTPVRPVCWAISDDDAVNFVREWEAKIN